MKKVIPLIIIATLYFSCSPSSNSNEITECIGSKQEYTGDIILKTQTDVNNFNKCISKLNGFLVIDGFGITSDHIVDLSPLDGKIDTITRSLLIGNLRLLKNIDPFVSIKRIDESVVIENNDELESIEGFPNSMVSLVDTDWPAGARFNNWPSNNITKYEGVLIKGNSKLKTLRGLHNLTAVGHNFSGGGVHVSNNNSLINMEGLQALEESHDLTISNNKNLINLKGLEGLKRVRGYLTISSNDKLILDNLEGIGALTIAYNSNLLKIESLSNVKGISGGQEIYSWGVLIIKDNVSLKSLEGLHNIQKVVSGEEGDTRLLIENNNNLINLKGLRGIEKISGGFTKITIENNELITTLGLSSLKEIKSIHPLSDNNSGYSNFEIKNNPNLSNLDDLSNLEVVNSKHLQLQIHSNASLSNFCGLNNLVLSNTNLLNLDIANNSFNPTLEDLTNGDCSQ
ncbi:hypothetical protein [Flavivirga sp. 57AJ16]|uniref:hypothetical protein n=1 Tax=Flavivirga sp. 57AJ16 TaxID=3025307 RepID=UPI0023657129|nr:hypothetical protein [Flavivirga sp. 57AJ16]MDD7885919.1 hypothetical protein [Flavivirga sp. 57AJ16]